jgi:molybdopterin molybdotransferase
MPLIPLEEARRIIDLADFMKPRKISIKVWRAINMIAAEDLRAPRDIPPIRVAAMDGYAVRLEDLESFDSLRISGKLFPGDREMELGKGEAVYVSTGAPIPLGANAIVRLEAARVRNDRLYVVERLWEGKDIVDIGEVARKGNIIVKKGTPITPYDLGLLIKAGILEIPVYRLRALVMAVGDELSRFDDPGDGGIRDSVSPMIMGLLSFAESEYVGVIGDDLDEIVRAIEDSISKADLVVTSGGTSVGEKDLVKKAVARIGELLFEGVTVNVIKRCSIAVVGGKPIALLPGSCVASVACFHEHLLHVISRMVEGELRIYEEAVLGQEIRVDHNMDSLYLFTSFSGVAYPLRWGPGRCYDLTKANAMGILKRGMLYRKGEKIYLQRLLPYPWSR